ncbi:MAG: hypothetical protein JNM17_23675 [Archangium sp.]|nr:hypothetical protein [Archangium sp.]
MTDEVGLQEIWNEMKTIHGSLKRGLQDVREELTRTNERIDVNGRRIEQVSDEMKIAVGAVHKRTVESEFRLATAVTELTDTVKVMQETITGWRGDHRKEVGDIRTELDGIKTRLDRIESRLPEK